MASPYLLKAGTDRIYPYSEILAKRKDMQPFDGPLPNQDEEKTAEERQIRVGEELKPISSATKDELEAFAQEFFTVDLDKRKSKGDLVDEVLALIETAEKKG